MSSVKQGTLDRILAIKSNYEKTTALLDFFEENDLVELRVADGELKFHFRRRNYHATPGESIYVSPSLASELLGLHGRRGVYYRVDPATGIHEQRASMISEVDQEQLKRRKHKHKFQTAYLYHYEGGDEPEVEPEPEPETQSQNE